VPFLPLLSQSKNVQMYAFFAIFHTPSSIGLGKARILHILNWINRTIKSININFIICCVLLCLEARPKFVSVPAPETLSSISSHEITRR
jgi:hypothetical protein